MAAGRLKLYLGAAPGVGTTTAMLEAARRLAAGGADVLIATELDLEAVLSRAPAIAVIDELAHANPPGSRHPWRWQDALDLLDDGIHVHATLTLAQIDSLGDAVAQITGARAPETVPDVVIARAGELELVDRTPDGMPTALRALALRWTADRLDAADTRPGPRAPTPERVLVCVGPSPGSERLVRAASRIADGLHAPWLAVHVDVSDAPPLRVDDRDRVDAHLALAEELGAQVVRLAGASVADTLLAAARERNVTRIVAGKPTHSRWRDRARGSLLDSLIRGSADIELHVISPVAAIEPRATAPRGAVRRQLASYLPGVIAVATASAIGALAADRLTQPDDAMLYLFAIMLAALGGRGAGLVAAALSVVAYDFFFVDPRYTLAVSDVRNIMTFAVMFMVGTAVGGLVARLRHAEAASRQRERRTAALLAFTAEAARAVEVGDVAAAVVAHVEDVLGAPTVVLLPGADGELTAAAGLEPLAAQEVAVARWAHTHRRPAGRGTDTQPEARLLAVPLWVGSDSAGVVALQIERARRRIDLDGRQLLEALARQAGVAIARLRLASEARDAAMRAAAEELRSSLLSTVSHDLRTPLAAITGMATALRDAAPAMTMTADQVDSLDTIVDEATRLGQILTNLLAITRVESGAEVRREWVPVDELIGAALGRADTVLAGRAVAIAIAPELAGDAALGALVDPILIELLVVNLLENAAKHTPAGTPIDIAAAAAGTGIQIEISDRGPGLPDGPEAPLFEKFTRGPSPRAPGAGLGLAVCRAIAIAHGGRIAAIRRTGGGATFQLWLPAGRAPAALSSPADL